MSEKLAKEGGRKAVRLPVPVNTHGNGTYEIGKEEKANLIKAIDRKRLFRFSFDVKESFVAKFENEFKKKMGTKYSLAVASGTTALMSGLAGIQIGPGDEVIIPAYTFIASPASVILAGAVPVIAEIDDTLTIDPDDIERKITRHTKAIMPVHMRGIPCDMDRIMKIARKHKLLVIEDVAQADGASYKGRRLGSIGDVGCFSLQMYKIITAGEGGAVITNNNKIYARAAMYHDSALCFWKNVQSSVDSPIPGGGFRMSELAGAVAFAQIKKLDNILNTMRRRKNEILNGITGLKGINPIRIADPKGDASLSLNLSFKTAEEAKKFAETVSAEGVPVGTIHNQGFPDRHIYRYWEYVLGRITHQRKGRECSWHCPRYKGNAKYSPDMCPKTIDYLTRTVSIGISQQMKSIHSNEIVRAIKKVAHALYG